VYASYLAFSTENKSSGTTDTSTEKMRILGNGNVGIGTTSPWTQFVTAIPYGKTDTTRRYAAAFTSNDATAYSEMVFSTIGAAAQANRAWSIQTSEAGVSDSGNLALQSGGGNVGIGTTNPTELLHLSTKSSYNIPIYLNMTSDRFGGGSLPIGGIKFKNAQNEYEIARIEVTNSAAWEADAGVLNFMTRPAGGTLTQRMRIDNAGSVSINSLASCGGIQTNGSGTMSCTSDARLKDIKGSFTQGLDAINKINPETYSWKQDSGLYDNGILYSGFIAQNIEQAIPEAVNYNAAGYRQVNTTTILATTINAIKELDLKVNDLSSLDITSATSLGSLIKSFLADATNGIGDFFANRVRTKELCISDATGETCLTRSQIDSLITKPSGDNTSSSSPTQAELDAQKLIDDKAALDAKAKLDQAALDAQAVLDQATADAKAKAITDAAAQAEIDAQKLKDTQAAAQKLIDDQVAAEAAAKAAQAAAGAKAKAAADAAL
jgi:hypothetical protein